MIFFQSIQELVAPRAPFLLRVLACIASHCLAASVERAGGARAFKIGVSEVTVSSSCVGSHCITLLCRFSEARLRRERQARFDVLSLWVTFLPQRSSSVALRALVSFARVGSQRRTLPSLVGGPHLRHEKQARSDMFF